MELQTVAPKARRIEVRYRDLKAARDAGEQWTSIEARLGVSNTSLTRVWKSKTDATITLRKKRRAAKPAVALEAVNRALSFEAPSVTMVDAAGALSEHMQRLGVRRLVIDLDRGTVDLTTTESYPLAHAGGRR